MAAPPTPPPVHPARLDAGELVAIFVGGVLGTLARAGLAEAVPHATAAWPWATFAVNLVGTFVLGVGVTRPSPSRHRRLLLGAGFCGALTTFSTLELELLRMLDAGDLALALGYAAATAIGGLAAVVLATRLARPAPLTR